MEEGRLLSILSNWKEEIMNDLARKFESLEQTITSRFEIRLSAVENKVNNLEMEIKTKNVLLHGLIESEKNVYDLETITTSFIKDKVYDEFALKDVNYMKRIGKLQTGKIRPIIISLVSRRVRDILIKNSTNLKNSQHYISEDFPKNVQEIRKKLIPDMIKARRAGKYAIIRYDKLLIKDKLIIKESHKKIDNTTTNKPTTNSEKRPLLLSPTEERDQDKNQNVEKKKKIDTTKTTKVLQTKFSFLKKSESLGNINAKSTE